MGPTRLCVNVWSSHDTSRKHLVRLTPSVILKVSSIYVEGSAIVVASDIAFVEVDVFVRAKVRVSSQALPLHRLGTLHSELQRGGVLVVIEDLDSDKSVRHVWLVAYTFKFTGHLLQIDVGFEASSVI